MLARCVSTMLLRNNGSGTSNRDPSVVIHNDSRRRRDEKNCASQAPRYETETKAHILHTFGQEHNNKNTIYMHFQNQVKIKRTFCRHILFKQTYIAQELGSKYKPVLEQCATPLVHCWHHRGQIVVVRAIKRIVAVAEQQRMVMAAQQRLGAPVSGHCTTRTSCSPASWSTDDPLNFTVSVCVGTLRELICIVQNLCNVEIYNCAGCRQRASGRCSPLSSLTRDPKSSHSVSKQQQRTTCNLIQIALHTFC